MSLVIRPVMVGAVAAKVVVARDLLFGEEFGRSEVRDEVAEAKPRPAPFDVTQHLPQSLLRNRPCPVLSGRAVR